MKHSYSPFLAIFLICIIIGFSYYKQLNELEGMENRESIDIDPAKPVIIERGNKKVRRREPLKIKKPKPLDIAGEFRKMKDFFKKIGQSFKALGSNIMCGFKKIKSLPDCMMWYMLQVLGKILYFPINFFLWLFARFGMPQLREAEREVWKQLENLDKLFHKTAGFHIIHFPDDVVEKCYKCKGLVPFPKF